MATAFIDTVSQKFVRPDILNAAQCVLLGVNDDYSGSFRHYLAPAELREANKIGILPNGSFVYDIVWDSLFPYDAVQIPVSRNLNKLKDLNGSRINLLPYQPQQLQIKGYPYIGINLTPLGVGHFEEYEFAYDLTRELWKFALSSKHYIQFDHEDFLEYADAPLLHLKNRKVETTKDPQPVSVIQVKIEKFHDPIWSPGHKIFSWAKLFYYLEQMGLRYCEDDFMIRAFLDTMPEVLELESFKPAFDIIQPLQRKSFYMNTPDEKLIMGFRWNYNPFSYQENKPIVKLSSWEHKLSDPVFSSDKLVYTPEDESNSICLWMTLPRGSSQKLFY